MAKERSILALSASLFLIIASVRTEHVMAQTVALSKNGGQTGAMRVYSGISDINDKLALAGAHYRAAYAEYLTSGDSGIPGGVLIIAKDVGNKRLDEHFVPGDPRRGGFTDIGYIVDRFDGVATAAVGTINADATTAQLDASMMLWEDQKCSHIPITNFGAFNFDFGVVQFLLGFGGVPAVFADITHAGWLRREFFDALVADGGDFILGVTFTFLFIDNNGKFTDIDGNRKLDVAFREIYYNNNFAWSPDPGPTRNIPGFQIKAVATHEAGHGLSQAHFGKIFLDAGSNQLHFAPFAVMNEAISSRTRITGLEGTDAAGHCSIWAPWP